MKKNAILDISKVEDLERSLKTAHQYLNVGNIEEGHRYVLNALEIVVCESSNVIPVDNIRQNPVSVGKSLP